MTPLQILVPTDFSTHSSHALQFAIDLTNQLDAQLHLLHVYKETKVTGSFKSMDDIIRQDADEDMNDLISSIASFVKTDRPIIGKVSSGYTTDVIKSYAQRYAIDLIVMGTQGQNSMNNLLFGSTTKKMIESIHIPVLAIPMDVKHDLSGGSFFLAVDDKAVTDMKGIALLDKLAHTLGKKVDIIHVIKDGEDPMAFDFNIGSLLPNSYGEVNIISSNEKLYAIKNHVISNQGVLLGMIHHKTNFFQRLLLKSHSAEELDLVSVPLFIIPE